MVFNDAYTITARSPVSRNALPEGPDRSGTSARPSARVQAKNWRLMALYRALLCREGAGYAGLAEKMQSTRHALCSFEVE